jgi:hypothetical protein
MTQGMERLPSKCEALFKPQYHQKKVLGEWEIETLKKKILFNLGTKDALHRNCIVVIVFDIFTH